MILTPKQLVNSVVLVPVPGGLVLGIINNWNGEDEFEVVWGDVVTRVTYDVINRNYAPPEKLKPDAGKFIGKFYKTKQEALKDLCLYRIKP
jgi:hypothetical protein